MDGSIYDLQSQSEIWNSSMGAELSDHPKVVAAVYIVLSVVSLLINSLVILLIWKHNRMPRTPKYWLVMAISSIFIFQATVVNNFATARRLSSGSAAVSCNLWSVSVVTNNFIVVGLVCWAALLMQLDFLMCVLSVAYTRYYRIKVLIPLISVTWTSVISIVIALAVTFGSLGDSATFCEYNFSNTDVLKYLIWIIVYVPLGLNLACISTFRCRSRYRRQLDMNQDISDSLYASSCPLLPPSDHVIFLSIIIIFYLPKAILTNVVASCTPNNCDVSTHLVTAATVMNDNAGSAAPMAWFLFRDLRVALARLIGSVKGDRVMEITHSTATLTESESSELRMYDSYPYCSN